MRARRFLAIVAILILAAFASGSFAQAQTGPQSLGSISGQVTLNGKPFPGVEVQLWGKGSTRRTVMTDESGKYKFADLIPGDYGVSPSAKGYAVRRDNHYLQGEKVARVAAGETTQDINFELVPGAKITGHIRGADGRPIANQEVALAIVENSDFINSGLGIYVSDSQGNYMIDRIPPGRYAVYAGIGTLTGMMPSAGGIRVIMYPQTFYRAAAEIKDATIIEVQAGSVTEGIDITFPQPSITNELTVRVVDEITGFPVPNCKGVLSYGTLEERMRGMSGNYGMSDFKIDDKGKFNIANALLGHYTFHLGFNAATSSYGQDVSFDILDPNVGGLEIKMQRAGSVSGVIVIDGENGDKSKLAKLKIAAIRDTDGRDLTEFQLFVAQLTGFQSTPATIGPDGQFKLAGLSPGKQQIFISDPNSLAPPDFTVLRIEQNGNETSKNNKAINIGSGKDITGVRVIVQPVRYGSIHGKVKIEGGQLEGMIWREIRIRRTDGPQWYPYADIDPSNSFLIEKLQPGEYELMIEPKNLNNLPTVKQIVQVNADSKTEVVMTMKSNEQ